MSCPLVDSVRPRSCQQQQQQRTRERDDQVVGPSSISRRLGSFAVQRVALGRRVVVSKEQPQTPTTAHEHGDEQRASEHELSGRSRGDEDG